MAKNKIDKYIDETLESFEEKQKKSEKRLKIFSWVFFILGLEFLGILMHYNVYSWIKIIAIDVYAIVTVNSFYRLGLKDGISMENEYREMDNARNKEIISKLKSALFKSGEYGKRLIPFVYLDRLYFVSKENGEYILYDDHKILVPEPTEDALSIAKMAWEDYQQSFESGE